MESTNEMEGNSNAKLKEILANRISDLFRSNLSLLEIVLPHDKGDNSDNEKDFNALRSRILRVGNDGIDETTIIVINQKIRIYLANGRRKTISLIILVFKQAKIKPLYLSVVR